MPKNESCPVCTTECTASPVSSRFAKFYECPLCGRYEIESFDSLNHNKLAPYLLYNSFKCTKSTPIEYRYHTDLNSETCDKYKSEFNSGDRSHGHPVHISKDIIDAWYPKSFAEKIDCILIYIHTNTPHMGQEISWSFQEAISSLFIDRYDIINNAYSTSKSNRSEYNCEDEVHFMLDYLSQNSYIKYLEGPDFDEYVSITLLPEGYKRVDAIQKNSAYGRNVLVAMKFGDDTLKLREAIREAITSCDYKAIFIDEVQHNDFITPELLKHIRDSKFVVVDLTHQNNGAYFEEGYAMGLGKPVIQLCQQGTQLHFDIAQKNTIMWDTEAEIPLKLSNRIKATID